MTLFTLVCFQPITSRAYSEQQRSLSFVIQFADFSIQIRVYKNWITISLRTVAHWESVLTSSKIASIDTNLLI